MEYVTDLYSSHCQKSFVIRFGISSMTNDGRNVQIDDKKNSLMLLVTNLEQTDHRPVKMSLPLNCTRTVKTGDFLVAIKKQLDRTTFDYVRHCPFQTDPKSG